MEIEYYNANILPEAHLEEINGTRQSVDDIAKRALQKAKGIDVSDYGISPDFDPLCRTRASRWEQSFATMLFSVTGQIPSRDEIKMGRRIVECMPKDIKKSHVDQEFILGPLVYTVAFQKSSESEFQENANNVQDVAKFLALLAQRTDKNTTFNSLLCGHRVDSSVKKDSLISRVPAEKMRRTARLITGIGRNATRGTIEQHWYQQRPTKFASSNMFPTVFKSYLVNNRLVELFSLLEAHNAQIQQVFDQETTETAAYFVEDLDAITQGAFCIAENTPNWRSIDPTLSSIDATLTSLVGSTIGEVARFSNIYGKVAVSESEEEMKRSVSSLTTAGGNLSFGERELVDSIQQFYSSLELTLESKALYEVSLSQAWGQLNAHLGAIAIGVDRDHTRQRPDAYSLGQRSAGVEDDQQFPLLYGRYARSEKPGSLLSMYNVRQFWV